MQQSNGSRAVADHLILASTYSAAYGGDVRLRRLAERGALHRVARGLYYPANVWNELSPDQRYAGLVRGTALTRRPGLVVSHQSAAVLWGLPVIGQWPRDVHFLAERSSGGRSEPGVRKHAVGIDVRDVVVLDDVLVTTAARTAVDVAATLDFTSAVAAVDRVLYRDPFGRVAPLATIAELNDVWQRMLPFRGCARARAVIDFATHLAGSVLESASRVNMALGGFPQPELQHPFVIEGRTVRVDFFWQEYDAIGEADGRAKYLDPLMLKGRSPEDVLFAEKQREDALRRRVRAFTRWDYAVGLDVLRLRARLVQLGLPARHPRGQVPDALTWRG